MGGLIDVNSTNLLTDEEVRSQLISSAPDQWPILLNIANRRLGKYGYKTLAEFITGRAGSGLAMTLEQAKGLLYFNPNYNHIADELCEKIGIAKRSLDVALANEQKLTVKVGGDQSKREVLPNGAAEHHNTKEGILRRLAKADRNDLLDKYEKGMISANQAAIYAGFRKKRVQVVADQEGFQRALDQHLPGYEIVKKSR